MADTSQEFADKSLAEQVEDYDRLFGIVADGVIGAAGGLAGTAMMMGVLFIASSVGAFETARFGSLAQPLGFPPEAVAIGFAIFLANGMVPWPLVFAAIMEYLPGERPPVSGMFFGGALWTGFVLGFYTGQTGVMLVAYLVLTFVAHLVYGLGLGLVFEYLSNRPDSLV